MAVSVIVPTYNGAHKLPALLSSLSAQTIRDFELIIVVDGSTDHTEEYLKKALPGFGNARFIVQPNGGRSVVRNNGARESRNDLLVFIDDDMEPIPEWLSIHLEHHQKFPGSLLTGAQVDDPARASTDFLRYKAGISQQWAKKLTAYEGRPLPEDKLHLTAANCSMRKDLFNNLGGFDERLRDAEDFDLAIRAHKSGIPIYYSYKAFAWHNDPVTLLGNIKRLRQYIRAHKMLRTFKPELYADVRINKPQELKGIKRNIFSNFARPVWIKLLQPGNKLYFLPKRVRYKLYDLVTYSYGIFFTNRPLDGA